MSGRKKNRTGRRAPRRIALLLALLVAAFAAVSVRAGGPLALVLRAKGCPQSVISLARRNSETIPFAFHYPGEKEPSIDLTAEVKKGAIPHFLQWDERWGYQTYGGDILAVTGCGPTCLSMVWCGLTGGTQRDPGTLAAWAEESGYYVEGTGTAWSLMSEGAERIGLRAKEVPASAEAVAAALNSGQPIIASVGPGDFTSAGHFIVLAGLDSGGQVIVRDPNSKKRSRKTWDRERLLEQTKQMWSFSAS